MNDAIKQIWGIRVAGVTISAFLGAMVAIAGCNEPAAPQTDGSAPTNPPVIEKTQSAASHAMSGHDMSQHGGHAMGTKGIDALKGLKGKDFDIAFLSQMITHHEAALEMAKQAQKTATQDTTRQVTQKVIDAQTKEIARMRQWLKDWYSVEPDAKQQKLVQDDMAEMMAMPIAKDADFYTMMIPHHQGAIDMSELVPARSEKSEVKKLAQDIITAQKAEIATYHKALGH